MRKEVIFSGIGGQGIVKSAVLLSSGANMAGFYAAQAASYDAAARGALTMGESVISDEPIDFPHVVKADVHVSFNEKGLEKYSGKLKKGGVVIYDSSIFKHKAGENIYPLPATKLSIDEIGKPFFANIVMLGALVNFTEEITYGHMKNSIKKNFNRFIEENLKALKLGFEKIER